MGECVRVRVRVRLHARVRGVKNHSSASVHARKAYYHAERQRPIVR